MDNNMLTFVIAVLGLAVIVAAFLLAFALKRKNKTREVYDRSHVKSYCSGWLFCIILGLFFMGIGSTCSIVFHQRIGDWAETPAVISYIDKTGTGSNERKYPYIDYQYEGKFYERVSIGARLKERGAKNPTEVGKQITVLVNPKNPEQISAYSGFTYGIFFALMAVGALIFIFGIYIAVKDPSKSRETTADQPPVEPDGERRKTGAMAKKVAVALLASGILLFVYFIASFRIFLFFVAWMVFLAVYGMIQKAKEKRAK